MDAKGEVVRAWQRYLRETKGVHVVVYPEREEEAWVRLQARLRLIEKRAARVAA